MIKVFTTNSDGKIEFTEDELKKLLNEVWEDGCNSCYRWPPSTITSDKIITTPIYANKPFEITCGTGK